MYLGFAVIVFSQIIFLCEVLDLNNRVSFYFFVKTKFTRGENNKFGDMSAFSLTLANLSCQKLENSEEIGLVKMMDR